MKICTTCKENKSNTEFSKSSRSKSGLYSRCKTCARAATSKSYYKHQEKQVKRAKEYRDLNPDAGRDAKFKYKYGITLNDYRKMFKEQGGKCAICFEPENYPAFDVDHDHKTGKVRGLLCRKCNMALGQFRDSVDLIQKAITYLKENS